uniref:Uncharacterized protein n=1 Tax=Lepeophtheirus salmonis TaxID=72036 RepID=A0A0K2TDX1_LEPSM
MCSNVEVRWGFDTLQPIWFERQYDVSSPSIHPQTV